MSDALETFPLRPPSEVEWEDVLLRVELMTRALRNTTEELEPHAIAPVLEAMLAREARIGAWLEAHAVEETATSGTKRAASSAGATISGPPEQLVDRLVSLRARNFAMVQRRGLGVWEWRGPFEVSEGSTPEATAYQLLTWLVREDVRSLAALRAIGRGEGAPAC
jgi:hypothetical protein